MDPFFGLLARLIQRKLWMVGVLGAACVVMIFALEDVMWQTVLVALLLIVVLASDCRGSVLDPRPRRTGLPQARWNPAVIVGLGSRG